MGSAVTTMHRQITHYFTVEHYHIASVSIFHGKRKIHWYQELAVSIQYYEFLNKNRHCSIGRIQNRVGNGALVHALGS